MDTETDEVDPRDTFINEVREALKENNRLTLDLNERGVYGVVGDYTEEATNHMYLFFDRVCVAFDRMK